VKLAESNKEIDAQYKKGKLTKQKTDMMIKWAKEFDK